MNKFLVLKFLFKDMFKQSWKYCCYLKDYENRRNYKVTIINETYLSSMWLNKISSNGTGVLNLRYANDENYLSPEIQYTEVISKIQVFGVLNYEKSYEYP